MSASSVTRWYYPWVPLGLAGGIAVLVGWLLIGPASHPVQAGDAQLHGPAGIQTTTKKILLAVSLTNAGEAQLQGTLKAELVAAYSELMSVGIVENIEAFKAFLIVERDPNDPNRINVLLPPDLVNQLRIFAMLVEFRLHYSPGALGTATGATTLAAMAAAPYAPEPAHGVVPQVAPIGFAG